ncbi:SH3 domain-containing protein C23A1.17-like [Lynx rufus]|uniref:SH3 domain-containing protein C23A1.17-like n=1 Tax=Lynx rufus TaxID=61384 RepID=UPI001F1268ED|nr:SH3 domain-containing protein C23A1.17-like [Lynx rufus]
MRFSRPPRGLNVLSTSGTRRPRGDLESWLNFRIPDGLPRHGKWVARQGPPRPPASLTPPLPWWCLPPPASRPAGPLPAVTPEASRKPSHRLLAGPGDPRRSPPNPAPHPPVQTPPPPPKTTSAPPPHFPLPGTHPPCPPRPYTPAVLLCSLCPLTREAGSPWPRPQTCARSRRPLSSAFQDPWLASPVSPPGRGPCGSLRLTPDHRHGPGPPPWASTGSLPVSSSCPGTCPDRSGSPVSRHRCLPLSLPGIMCIRKTPASLPSFQGPRWAPVQTAPCTPRRFSHLVPTLFTVTSVPLPRAPPPGLPETPEPSARTSHILRSAPFIPPGSCLPSSLPGFLLPTLHDSRSVSASADMVGEVQLQRQPLLNTASTRTRPLTGVGTVLLPMATCLCGHVARGTSARKVGPRHGLRGTARQSLLAGAWKARNPHPEMPGTSPCSHHAGARLVSPEAGPHYARALWVPPARTCFSGSFRAETAEAQVPAHQTPRARLSALGGQAPFSPLLPVGPKSAPGRKPLPHHGGLPVYASARRAWDALSMSAGDAEPGARRGQSCLWAALAQTWFLRPCGGISQEHAHRSSPSGGF